MTSAGPCPTSSAGSLHEGSRLLRDGVYLMLFSDTVAIQQVTSTSCIAAAADGGDAFPQTKRPCSFRACLPERICAPDFGLNSIPLAVSLHAAMCSGCILRPVRWVVIEACRPQIGSRPPLC